MKLNNLTNAASYLSLNWPGNSSVKPENVHAYTTLTAGGFSTGDYSNFNLASHVGDDMQAVKANREKLVKDLGLPSEPVWLEQVHSNKVVRADEMAVSTGRTDMPSVLQADASITTNKDVVCAVLTADCLPVFFCNRSGTEVAVAHAGWRGLHAGIITNTVNKMKSSADELLVSLGPAIGAKVFEVGEEVFRAFVSNNTAYKTAFEKTDRNHYLCDIYQLATIELHTIGITRIAGGGYCTYSENHRFYSYRRKQNTGRMASIIWIS